MTESRQQEALPELTRAHSLDRRQFLAACTALGGLALSRAVPGQTPAQPHDTPFADLLAAVPESMEREGVPGLQVALVRDGEVVLFESYGVANAETGVPVTAETVFEAASLSKPVFAYLVMNLVEEGTLDLDAPLQEILEPPAAGPPDRLKALTARLILPHMTGFPNWYSGKGPLNLRASQGRLFAYSGMAYEYLQRVVEKLTGQPLEILLRDRIFMPLKMDSAHMTWQEDFTTRLAFGHGPNGTPTRREMPDASAASSLVCNARDYARFTATLLNPPPASDLFLEPETLKQIFTPRIEAAEDIQWGLGWGLQRPRDAPFSFFHWGNNGSVYNAFVVGCPSTGEGAVIMTNSGKGLRACRDLIPMAVSGDHPALRWNRVVGG